MPLEEQEEEAKKEAPEEEAPELFKKSEVDTSVVEKISLYILLVEDTKALARIMMKILQKAGHTVVHTMNGYEAIAALRKSKMESRKFDIIVSDLMMPEMDGYTLVETIKEKDLFDTKKVIIVTAKTDKASVLRCARCGVSNYIIKPFDADRVWQTVNKVGGVVAVAVDAPEENEKENSNSDTEENGDNKDSADSSQVEGQELEEAEAEEGGEVESVEKSDEQEADDSENDASDDEKKEVITVD